MAQHRNGPTATIEASFQGAATVGFPLVLVRAVRCSFVTSERLPARTPVADQGSRGSEVGCVRAGSHSYTRANSWRGGGDSEAC
ncbi:hypothetical protein D9753_35290 [Streptomyces dangxiongensis]|uniref:Uncharacterized protein n=1 Tax=Streptomyces dangxiongensis TaxID=1442032 RepID=A0A3G2JQP5_9ACTN|nr:hypothetical protein D9753_35290 [Streptomyces dangxiongensis]